MFDLRSVIWLSQGVFPSSLRRRPLTIFIVVSLYEFRVVLSFAMTNFYVLEEIVMLGYEEEGKKNARRKEKL